MVMYDASLDTQQFIFEFTFVTVFVRLSIRECIAFLKLRLKPSDKHFYPYTYCSKRKIKALAIKEKNFYNVEGDTPIKNEGCSKSVYILVEQDILKNVRKCWGIILKFCKISFFCVQPNK